MKKIVSLASLSVLVLLAQAQTGYNINITLKPYKNSYIYLGYHYGKMKALADSVLLDQNSTGTFKGKQALPGGIYFIVSPRKEILFELLLDNQQNFSIKADSAGLPNSVVFTGSADNTAFQNYTKFANTTGMAINKANMAYAAARNTKDSAAITAEIKALADKMQRHRDSIIKKQPHSILTALFEAMKEPVVPPAAKHPKGKYDTAFAFHYFKSHFWDGVSFTDERLIRTPFFESKLIKYYKDLVSPNPDSINKEVDHMLLYSRSNKEMFKFLLVHFVQKYISPEYMGQDAVFVHLFEKYINNGQADFFTAQYKDHMTKRAYSLMANLIGQPAANMEMVDSLDKPLPLYSVQSDMIVICFWDPTCSHCKEVVPKVDSIYNAKWKNQGITVYGVMVDGGKETWLQFIREKGLKNWLHVYQLPSQQQVEASAGKAGFRQLYDVYQTPVLYLLDKDKRIVAKKLNYQQLDEVINLKLKTSKSN
jgi:hypothetical protein